MIQPTRVLNLNLHPIARNGKYLLYWMQASQRTRFNHALEYAIEKANQLKLPLVVGFGLMDDYPEANERHYAFMLQGLCDVYHALQERQIKMVVLHGNPADAAIELAAAAAMVVCDRGYLRHQKQWRQKVAAALSISLVQVESEVIVPVEVTSDKREFAARTIRPKLHRQWAQYFTPIDERKVDTSSLHLTSKSKSSPSRRLEMLDVTNPKSLLEKLKLDRSVSASNYFVGGQNMAKKMLANFIEQKLDNYKVGRNEPADGHTSMLSAYLHFGQISPLEMALTVSRCSDVPQLDRDTFIEELAVRRELSHNYVNFTADYDQYDQLPAWALRTLAEHETDERPILYGRKELEQGKTIDPYWNAAQTEMVKTGFMHNYMRMYWGKKILEWSKTPKEAFESMLYLNNKYQLDGRDVASFANIGWILGLHDRPWGPPRKIFGLIRYMNLAGLERKFDMAAYVEKVKQY